MTLSTRHFLALSFLLLCAAASVAAKPFKLALPGYKFQFPRDHASHPDYATEWWYYTGHLQAKNGRRFGYQMTFFRFALTPDAKARKSKWATRDVIAAHFAITDETNGRFYFCDRVERAAVGLAGADSKTPHVWLGDWNLRFTGDRQNFAVKGRSFAGATKDALMSLNLTNKAAKEPVIHGINGVSQKAPGRGQASHYYSFTRLKSSGTLKLGDETLAVTGESWFDKEFGSNQLGKTQIGWDWFSLQLVDGRELMLYQLRLRDGSIDPYSSGTLIERNGQARHLRYNDFQLEALSWWTSSESGAKYPAKWRVTIPLAKLQLSLEPTVAQQELLTQRSTNITYWEGSVRVKGTRGGQKLSGRGYMELTGYRTEFNATF